MSWTTPADIRTQVQKLWDRGSMLAGLVTGETVFPRRIAIKGPSAQELLERFEDARAWSREITALRHVRIETRSLRHRVLGNNALPCAVWLDRLDDAAALLRVQPAVEAFAQVLALTEATCPAVRPWLARYPHQALALAGDWPRLLAVVNWLREHPRPGIYIRQMDLPAVHSKFIEAHKRVLTDLLDLALPDSAVDATATGTGQFARRYGFADKPERIRLRPLDPACRLLPGGGAQDMTLDAESLATLTPQATRVFITENEINYLAFPPVLGSLVVFGAGYGFEALAQCHWLSLCRVHYWGDIDTHGFAILDQLRSRLPHVESLLMDRDTLMAFEGAWGTEHNPVSRDLPRLTAEERVVYDILRDNRLRPKLRLEQERIGFGWVKRALMGFGQ
ncbi:Wadjet anti-phage system protein JetD domain-containing protein [Achromobacter spanius]|uniref:Wadjet anti-phage system protein JetD domain-containing protein n=1 Tax=Achromobacter spanius TaxID=217203 RepID=UPI003F6913F3